jgi:hypothetical protein
VVGPESISRQEQELSSLIGGTDKGAPSVGSFA